MKNQAIKEAKPRKYKYHTSYTYKDKNGKECSFITQLYKIGVYGILNNNPTHQFSMTPGQIVSLEKRLKKQEEKGEITDLEFGRPITVTKDDEGFYEEVD